MENFRKQTTSYSHHDKQPGSFTKLSYKYKEALWAGMYLYDKENKRWWTPEQFYAEFSSKELNNYQVTNLLDNLVIRDPVAGINAGFKQLDQMEEEFLTKIKAVRERLHSFAKETFEYYQSKVPKR